MLSARINDVHIDTPKNLIPEDLKAKDGKNKKRNKFMDLLKSKDKKIAEKEKTDKFVNA